MMFWSMIPDEVPDYTKYSLEELRDVVRHADCDYDPERYVVLLEEIALHKDKNEYPLTARKSVSREARAFLSGNKYPPKVRRPLREWLFEEGDAPRTASHIIAWWEVRRSFWCCFVATLFVCDFLTGWLLIMFATAGHGSSNSLQAFASLLITLIPALFVLVFLMIPVNIVFCAAYCIDIALNIPLRFLGWRMSVVLLGSLLALTILVASLPIIGLLRLMTQR